MGADMTVIIIAFWIFAYMAPTVVAGVRRHNNASAIGALNILLGWTFLGWIAAMIWAMTSNVESGHKHARS
jgi:hypothetical protein